MTAGNYTITVKDFNSCLASSIVTIGSYNQPFTAKVISSSPAISPSDTGWINTCLNSEISLIAQGNYPNSGISYRQSDNTSKFQWDFGDKTPLVYGQNVRHNFNKPGGYSVRLTVTDSLGCQNTNIVEPRVRVSSRPGFKIGQLPQNVCINSEVKLNAQSQRIDSTYSVSVGTKTDTFKYAQSKVDTSFIPDDASKELVSKVTIRGFSQNPVVRNTNDLKRIWVNMEHSWARDLEIKIICPSQKTAILHKYISSNGNEIKIGIPLSNRTTSGSDGTTAITRNDPAFNLPGTGLEYSWTNVATRNWRSFTTPTSGFSLPSSDYAPEEPLVI